MIDFLTFNRDFGKRGGGSGRVINWSYFDTKTKIHLLNYIESRTDDNMHYVSLNKPHSRLTESGVELRLREMGKKLGVEKVHPHKFRRTMVPERLRKVCRLNRYRKFWDMSK